MIIPQSATNWNEALLQILETKCALFCTGFSPADVERDVIALDATEGISGEFEWCLTPGQNEFKSERLEVADVSSDLHCPDFLTYLTCCSSTIE